MPLFQQPFMSGGFPSMNRAAGAVGGWVELGRTTLGAASTTINVSSIPDKRYYMVLADCDRDLVGTNTAMRMGNGSYDSGSNYADRYSSDGAADATTTSQTSMFGQLVADVNPNFSVGYLANRSASEKLWINHVVHQRTAGAANAPTRREICSKHAFTSNPIDQLQFATLNTDEFQSGSEIVVLGWDPDDTHTNNFWEELADVSWSSGSSFDTGTFTAKKYLWVQFWTDSATTNYRPLMTVGNSTLDTGTNYATRRSFDGATDVTSASRSDWETEMDGTANTKFGNMFIINNASNEKLSIGHFVSSTTAGAAAAPSRREMVGKWDNTSNQINIIGLTTSTGDFTGGQIKVWGSD